MLWIVTYLLTIPIANWMISHVGTCLPGGPCVIPVGFGLSAPSGVLMIGASLVLRDTVQRRYGWTPTLLCVLAGGVLSLAVAPPTLALASASAFLLSELLDQTVYTPLAKSHLALALLLSGVVGAVADSAVFLCLAFGSLNFIEGQVAGKLIMVGAGSVVILLASRGNKNISSKGD